MDPLHGLSYIAFVLVTTALFSRMWIDVSGSSAKDVTRAERESGLALSGRASGLSYSDSAPEYFWNPRETTRWKNPLWSVLRSLLVTPGREGAPRPGHVHPGPPRVLDGERAQPVRTGP